MNGAASTKPGLSPVPGFLEAFGARRYEALEPFLDVEVVYLVEGFDPVVGCRAVLAFWRRMFEAHQTIRMSLERHVRDGDLVLAAQRQLYFSDGRGPLVFDSIALYQLKGDRIRLWSDQPPVGALGDEHAALWRRLRADRW